MKCRLKTYCVVVAALAMSCSEEGLGARDSSATDAADGGLPEVAAAQGRDSVAAGIGEDGGRTCCGMERLGGHRYTYEANRVWHAANGEFLSLWEPIPESEYVPMSDGPRHLLSFSFDATAVVVARVSGTSVTDMYGTMKDCSPSTSVYELSGFISGGRLTIYCDELSAEITPFASEVPIMMSTRGPLSTSEPTRNGCDLPLDLPYDGYVPATYSDFIARMPTSPAIPACAGVRDGYCGGTCAGWLVAEMPRNVATAAAYDPATKQLVGYKSGPESFGVCHGTFPPLAPDGTPGWNLSKMDFADGCN